MRAHYILKWEDWTKGEHYTEMFIMKRDGIGFKNLGEGSWPDLSPDGKKIVYQKPNQGLWIKNIDGGGDRQIVGDGGYPAWSPSISKIAFAGEQLYVIDTNGTILNELGTWKGIPDWTISDTSKIIGYIPGKGNGLIINIETGVVDTLLIKTGDGAGFKWSPDGSKAIGHDENGWYISYLNGTNKWYLKP